MASVRVTLNKGLGFTNEEWAAAQKQVVVTNTTRKSVINLKTGEVRAVGDPGVAGTIPMMVGDDFRAIVVPQTVPGGKTLISITIDGVSYYFKKSEDFTDGNGYEICITVTLSGDASLVKKALIHIGYTADEMIETVCPVKDGAFSSIYYGLEPGVTYYCKASISNGIETKTSETFSFTVPAGTT